MLIFHSANSLFDNFIVNMSQRNHFPYFEEIEELIVAGKFRSTPKIPFYLFSN